LNDRPQLRRPVLRPIHPFPARMAPTIVWNELKAAKEAGELTVLDPMAGSGTTVATARLLGHRALGFDTDPLAVLVSRAWSSDVVPAEFEAAATDVLEEARLVLPRVDLGFAYPINADDETRQFVRYWFDPLARRQLTALAGSIKVADPKLRPHLWCAFSRLIIVKSCGASLAADVAHSRPHKVYEKSPVRPFDQFARAAAVVARHSPFVDGELRPAAVVKIGDARRLPLDDGSVDVVVTSPPYLNAIDYLRGHKFSLIWMGHSLRQLRDTRSTNVGSEVSANSKDDADPGVERALLRMGEVSALAAREKGMLRRYCRDMDGVLSEVARVLAPDGRAVLVVGDSCVKGVFVRNSSALRVLGEKHGLALVRRRRRPLPPNRRYLPPPTSRRAGTLLKQRMREEVILTFQRAA
jgi:SAM-dependent methyltransferase